MRKRTPVENMRFRNAVDETARGLALADLEREGGWDILDVNWSATEDVWNTFSDIEKETIFRTSSVIYACVRKICLVAPDANMEIGDWDGDSWEPDTSHPDLDLLRQPNPINDWRMFVWNLVGHLLMTGMSYVWKKKNAAGEIVGLVAVPTSSVSPIYSKRTGMLTHYRIATTDQTEPALVMLEDVFVMMYPDMSYPGMGVGPMQACLRDLQIDNSRAAQMIEILTQMHFASLVVTQEKPLTPRQKRDARSRVRDKIGSGKRGDVLFLSGKGTKAEFQRAPNDIDWPGTADLSESRIASAFGIPPILLGFRVGLQAGTFSNYSQAKTAFYQDTMKPLWQWMASTLERGLYRNEGDKETEVEANLDDVPELQADKDAVHERTRKDYFGGLLTKNQALEAIGQPVIGDAGEVYALPMNIIETPAGHLPLDTLPPPETVTETQAPDEVVPEEVVEEEEGAEPETEEE